MVKLEFTADERQRLHYERYYHPHPRVQRKMEALWLKSQGIAHREISRLTGISSTTLTSYLRAYQDGGVEALKTLNFRRPESDLKAHQATLEAYFRQHPPASIKQAMATIETLTGIRRSPDRVRLCLKQMGMKCRKVGVIPAKADVAAQETFKTTALEPRLAEAKTGQRAVFFVDAAHFVLAPFLGMLWSFTRLFVRAPAGRQRFNVLAALNALTHELVMVTNDTYITATTVCELLRQLAAQHLGVPITLVLDNARYQKCRIVAELAASLQIELLYLPAYSPNLNLIERLWKFVKKTCLYSKYYAHFADFKQAISDCLAQTHTTYKKELDALLTLNFQTFQESQIVAG
ncbi:MAG: IS630 family transposase [Comamonadaceae bacterium]|nr:IS630 family transposase [Comamonadaceae bacterium]MCK7496719.1 IS630 family transposase [Comamonadaceae bacterium]MCK7580626.1 IS630 family transposase [Chromatiales bacterium]